MLKEKKVVKTSRSSLKSESCKTGPKPEILKLEGNWENAVKKAMEKKRPKDGWPKVGE